MSEVSKHILISGRVQGVSFRAFTQDKAQEYGIKGWVRNLEDGRVEAVACGTNKDLESFIEDLKQGPSAANVKDIKVADLADNEKAESFIISPNSSTSLA